MELRLIEIIAPDRGRATVSEVLEEYRPLGSWFEDLASGEVMARALLRGETLEAVMDRLQQVMPEDDLRVIVFPVAAVLPRPPIEEEPEPESPNGGARRERVAREELYASLSDGARVTGVYMAAVVLAAIVAASGILMDNVAVVIGAMVIAPLLGPNVALSLATTLGDFDLGRRALRTNAAGFGIALGLSFGIGFALDVDVSITEIASRTAVGPGDLVLALASGAAGALAVTSGVSAALIGVMVAVALLPPAVVFGLLLGSAELSLALGAGLLLLANLICVNLAGVATFLIQGLRPRTWWETERARRASRLALALWGALLLLLALVVLYARDRPGLVNF